MEQDTVCQECGDVGYRHLLLRCRDCNTSATHQYCLDKVVFKASLVKWFCYECLQRHAEVTGIASLDKVSTERSPSHSQSGSEVDEPITTRVELPQRSPSQQGNSLYKLFTTKAHGDSNSKTRDGFMLGRNMVKRLRPDYSTSSDLRQRSTAGNVLQRSTPQNDGVDKVMPSSPNDACEKAFPCPGIKNNPGVPERSEDSADSPSVSQHDTTEASESSETMAECQKNVNMDTASSTSDESGEDPSENTFLGSIDHKASLRDDYVIAYRTYLSKAQKKRVVTLIREIKPESTVFIAMMRRNNVQPPGPFLGIDKEYALAYFPDESTHVTLERPGSCKTWHVKFYKREKSRKYMLMGQWLDFVRDNDVQEGNICLIFPTECGKRSTFTVCLLHERATNSRGGAGFRSCSGRPSAKKTSEVHIEEPTTGERFSVESDMHEIRHESLESEDSDDPCQPLYFVPCKSRLSKSQKKIVEQRVRAIQSEIPICVAVMKDNNVGMAQRWMLELASRYSSIYLAHRGGQNVELQCQGKTWEAKIMFHNGRRWFINGGWPNFARGNDLRVGDICLFELKMDSKCIMVVHIIRKEQF